MPERHTLLDAHQAVWVDHPAYRWAHPVMNRVGGVGNYRIAGLIQSLENGSLLVPEYQRGRVWSEEQKAKWCGFVLSGAPLPTMWIRQVNTEAGFRDELLDGQQRLHALIDWLAGRVQAIIPWSGEVAVCDSEAARMALTRRATPVCMLPPETTLEDALAVYLAINSGGTPHTEEELEVIRQKILDRARQIPEHQAELRRLVEP